MRNGLPALGALCALALLAGTAQAHDGVADRRSLGVGGIGEVRAVPDRARLSIAVDAFSPELKAAEAEASRVVRAYLAELKALGTRDEHVATTGITIHPEYVWDEKDRANRLTGYRARRDIAVEVTDLGKLGDYLLRATKVGINQVQPPVLESSKATELKREALVRAVRDARAKAELLAQTLGVKLGPIHSLQATDTMVPPPWPMARQMKAMAAAEAFDSGNQEMGVAAGEITFTASVSADFDIVP